MENRVIGSLGLGSKNDNGGAKVSTARRRIKELDRPGTLRQKAAHLRAPYTLPLAVNDSDLTPSAGNGLVEVV